ncbi:VOC family protein [Cellulomonas sp. ICMP 17802]|uniref:VOC family protein n=1 Tax=Cellulomonas sp. ICMP 17802 TaxID=3239199 RepID=UPI00351B13AC
MAEHTPRLDHVGLTVADLGSAQAWYSAAFGFVTELTARVDAVGLDVVMLVHPGRGDRLELLHRAGSARGPRAADPAAAALVEGYGHVAFDVRDLEETFDRLVALGARPVMAPQPSPEPGVRMAFVADPEGNLVELLDRSGGPA